VRVRLHVPGSIAWSLVGVRDAYHYLWNLRDARDALLYHTRIEVDVLFRVLKHHSVLSHPQRVYLYTEYDWW
jgi:hypothetical protein